jgi:hypothetical protein
MAAATEQESEKNENVVMLCEPIEAGFVGADDNR